MGRISTIIEQPKTVWQIIKEQKVDLTMPIICLINGAPVLRKDWGNVFYDGELISNTFISSIASDKVITTLNKSALKIRRSARLRR
ncbi:MAG: hypothetical protein VZR95_04215 [Alphaproteobacteria bacterium]